MGIFSFLGKQLIDVIEWGEEENGVLCYRFPMTDREIQNGAQLTVRSGQLALFVNEGNVADTFESGMHTLATKNLPVLTNLKHWDKAFQSPFKSDLYFFSLRDQLDQKWGTATPITVKDKAFGPIRLRANGTYSYRVKNPKTFFTKVSGSRDMVTTNEMEGQLRSVILTSIASHFGKEPVSFVDMAGDQMTFSELLRAAIAPSLEAYGLELVTFYVQSLSLPEELQSHLDKVASMKMVGDLKSYTQFQAADSISLAAQNDGGGAGAGMGMGIGMAMGQNMMNANQSVDSNSAEDPMETIKKMHELLKAGAITQLEFDAKKAELLGKIK